MTIPKTKGKVYDHPEIGEEEGVNEKHRLFMAKRRQQKTQGRDVYARRKDFFRNLHTSEESKEDDASSGRPSELSENSHIKASGVRKRSSGK